MEILQILKDLEGQLNAARQIGPFISGLNREECFMLVNKIRANLPEEVRRADRVSRESDRIVGDAREEAATMVIRARDESELMKEEARRQAELILEQARSQQQRMLEESEICRLAKAQAQEIVQNAEETAHKVRQGADNYAYDVLSNLEIAVGNVMGTIRNGKEKLEHHVVERESVRV